MLQSFFFVPSNSARFVNKSVSIKADYIIFDFEESVLAREYQHCFSLLSKIKVEPHYLLRVPFDRKHIKTTVSLIEQAQAMGFHKFCLAKVESLEDINKLAESLSAEISELSFWILIESPCGLLNLENILAKTKLNIFAVGIGSYDYARAMGMQHNRENLLYFRQKLLNISKAYQMICVDNASADIHDEKKFSAACLYAYNMGFEAKAVLHPLQLAAASKTFYFSKAEVSEAQAVMAELKNIKEQDFSIIRVQGRLYEKPHLERLQKILKWQIEGGYYDL